MERIIASMRHLKDEPAGETLFGSSTAGKVLTPIADNVWGAERPFMWNRIDVGGRSAVIRLSDGAQDQNRTLHHCNQKICFV